MIKKKKKRRKKNKPTNKMICSSRGRIQKDYGTVPMTTQEQMAC
jgi:hypothetical protein